MFPILVFMTILCPMHVTCEWKSLIGNPSAVVEVYSDQLIPGPAGQDDTEHTDEFIDHQDVGILQGVYAKVGSIENVTGLLIDIPGFDNGDNNNVDEMFKSSGLEDTNWVGVLLYPDLLGVEETTGTASTSAYLLMLDRMKKAMLLGASAIILLAMNKNVLRELDISQLISRPIVIIEDLENITYLLSALSSHLSLRVKIAFRSPPSPVLQTYTVWSSCWRAHPGGGVICMSDTGLSKVNPSLFWSYFYSLLAGIMLLLLIKTEHWRSLEDDTDDTQESVGRMVRQALSLMKIRRYRKSTKICNHDDSERDTCAICLDDFFYRQKIRVLPCVHEFHLKCVDPWLLRHPTCPLCKLNVIG